MIAAPPHPAQPIISMGAMAFQMNPEVRGVRVAGHRLFPNRSMFAVGITWGGFYRLAPVCCALSRAGGGGGGQQTPQAGMVLGPGVAAKPAPPRSAR